MMSRTLFQLETRLGAVELAWNERGLLKTIEWRDTPLTPKSQRYEGPWPIPSGVLEFTRKFQNYFEKGEPFGEIPWEAIDQSGWSAFQGQVYRAITRIPHGETRTYGWVAMRLGNHAATRAVGQALRNNPIPILVPCHRVVSVNSLGGFMGISDPDQPELALKRKLIALEEEFTNPLFPFLNPHSAMGYGKDRQPSYLEELELVGSS